jgi:predicted dehydrogenase
MNDTQLKIGLFGIGLDTYWPQFEGLKERLEGYLKTAEQKLSAIHPAVINAGLIDSIDAAFGAGKQVFCEKPLALNTASAERILAACAKAGGVLGIGHERRYEPAMEEMRRLFESGKLGRLLHMDANVSHNNFRKMDPSNWRRDPKHAPAGAWTALGIHLGDMFVSFAGKPVRIVARTTSQILPAPSEDFVSAEIDFGKLPRDTPPSIRDLLRRCLTKNPAERPAAAAMALFQTSFI